MVTRSEGYRRGAGKEAAALEVAEAFFESVFEVVPERIDDPEENYLYGDFAFPAGCVECKGQPINPGKYPMNFVEVCEETSGNNRYHAGGLDRVAALLGMSAREMEQVAVRDFRRGGSDRRIGQKSFVSVSIESIAGSLGTVYVNTSAPNHLYLYESDELMEHIRHAVDDAGLARGMGQSNDDTFAVLVPLAVDRWRVVRTEWVYCGDRDPSVAIEDWEARLGL